MLWDTSTVACMPCLSQSLVTAVVAHEFAFELFSWPGMLMVANCPRGSRAAPRIDDHACMHACMHRAAVCHAMAACMHIIFLFLSHLNISSEPLLSLTCRRTCLVTRKHSPSPATLGPLPLEAFTTLLCTVACKEEDSHLFLCYYCTYTPESARPNACVRQQDRAVTHVACAWC